MAYAHSTSKYKILVKYLCSFLNIFDLGEKQLKDRIIKIYGSQQIAYVQENY